MAAPTETFAFQAEINQLLSLIINTFYSNKEVFLRELISNASDAIDKIRYASLTTPSVLDSTSDLEIRIIADKAAKTLTIEDTGVGMTKQDLIKNLGTIAHSGTRSFMEALSAGQSPDISLIGQFGVGFYAAYLVAKNVRVVSKHNDDDQYVWESSAGGSFTVTKASPDHPPLPRGTRIVLELKDDQLEYLEETRIRGIVKKHSEYCSFPIKLLTTREEEVEVPEAQEAPTETTDTTPTTTGDKDVTVEDVKDSDDEADATAKPTKKKEKRTIEEFTQLNTQPPIWLRKPEDVKPEEHEAFYKSLSNDWEGPLAHKHFQVDGQVQMKAVIYIPKRAPFDMFASNDDKKRHNIKLYVRKVLITDDSTDLVPDYLSFAKGVVDSDDLPLNVSREMLQQNSILRVIKNSLVKKTIEMVTDLASSTNDDDKQKFKTFYENFSKNIKLGIHEDSKNRPKLLELLRYQSTRSNDEATSLKDYVTRMQPNQKKIYYITGESLASVKSSPFLERLKKRNLEVLYMVEPIDEYMVQQVREYDGKELVCCSKDGLELDQTEEEKAAAEALAKEWEPTCNKIKNTLDSRVQAVKLSERLSDNPCVLVTDRYGWSANMERIMKAQALRNQNNDMFSMMGSRKILEINPEHSILKEIKRRVQEDPDKDIAHIVEMLYSTSLIDSGFTLEEPSKYAQQIYKLLNLGITGIDDDTHNNENTETEESDINTINTPAMASTTMEEVD